MNSHPDQDAAGVKAQLGAIRSELSDLHQGVKELRAMVASLLEAVAQRDLPQQPAATGPSTNLARRHSQRLAAEVQRRAALLSSEDLAPSDGDTELDLLIDRLHDLALEQDHRF